MQSLFPDFESCFFSQGKTRKTKNIGRSNYIRMLENTCYFIFSKTVKKNSYLKHKLTKQPLMKQFSKSRKIQNSINMNSLKKNTQNDVLLIFKNLPQQQVSKISIKQTFVMTMGVQE